MKTSIFTAILMMAFAVTINDGICRDNQRSGR